LRQVFSIIFEGIIGYLLSVVKGRRDPGRGAESGAQGGVRGGQAECGRRWERGDFSQRRKDAKRIENRIDKALSLLAAWRGKTGERRLLAKTQRREEVDGQGPETLRAPFTGEFVSGKTP